MKRDNLLRPVAVWLTGLTMLIASDAMAAIQGINASVVDLVAKKAMISTPDGDSLQIWGFAPGTTPQDVAQYPGPTLKANEGSTLLISLRHDMGVDPINEPVSLSFPGIQGVSSICNMGVDGVGCVDPTIVAAGSDDVLIYTLSNVKAGTYLYQSGVNSEVQVEMGLFGALLVYPSQAGQGGATQAYNDPVSEYDREYLYFMSEMDPKLHYLAQNNGLQQWDNSTYHSVLWFVNGRNAPDTFAADNLPAMPHQPYGSLVTMYPGERVLLRVVNSGRNQHPLHLHGNHYRQVARDAQLILNASDQVSPVGDYTLNTVPGSSNDLIYEWTGKGVGWDVYGTGSNYLHSCNDAVDNRTGQPRAGLVAGDGYDDLSWEWCADHGKALPVVLPENQDLGFGGFYGGSPYLGNSAALPIGEGGLNPDGGMVFMWHSHAERELTNNDIYPGGMMTMLIIKKRP